MSRPAVFLDRDGTLIEDQDYPRDPDRVQFFPDTIPALKRIMEKGYLLFVVSNQSGLGRGIISDSEFRAVHEKFCSLLKSEGIEITEFAYCLHSPEDGCQCRKPGTALVGSMAKDHGVDLRHSFSIGDKLSDAELGKNLGATGCLVETGKGKDTLKTLDPSSWPHYSSILEFADAIPACPLA